MKPNSQRSPRPLKKPATSTQRALVKGLQTCGAWIEAAGKKLDDAGMTGLGRIAHAAQKRVEHLAD